MYTHINVSRSHRVACLEARDSFEAVTCLQMLIARGEVELSTSLRPHELVAQGHIH